MNELTQPIIVELSNTLHDCQQNDGRTRYLHLNMEIHVLLVLQGGLEHLYHSD